MTCDDPAVFGRQREIDELLGRIDRAGNESSAVVVDGPAGIGKSTVLGEVVDEATRRGCIVLRARPSLAESSLGFAVLGDLLRHADLGALAEPTRESLETALGVRRRTGEPPTPIELGHALVHLLDSSSGGPTVVVVIDDMQWVDAASRAPLAYAARRLPPAGVVLIGGLRTDTGSEPSDAFADVARLHLEPLDDDAIGRVVREAIARPTPDHVVTRIASASGGNPLFAVELARSVGTHAERPGRPIPLPASLGAAIASRISPFDPSTVEALAAVALLSSPSVRALADLGMIDVLHPAEVAGVVAIDGQSISFTHPLLASAAVDAVSAISRLSLHARLATVTDGLERTIHLALGSTHPDRQVALALIEAASEHIGRGASVEAADLADLGVSATPADDPRRWDHLLVVADAMFRAGRTGDAADLLQEVRIGTDDATTRARALLALATIEYERCDDAETAARLAREALELTDDADVRADAHTVLSFVMYTDFVAAADHADAALGLIRTRERSDPLRLSKALNAAATARFMAGAGLDRAAFEQAIELERDSAIPAADSAFGAFAALLKYADELDESRAMLESLTSRADAGSLPYALGHLPQLHLWSGEWDEAAQCARRHLDHAEATGQEAQANLARFNLAIVAAYCGNVAQAEQIGRALATKGRENDVPWTERNGAALLGFVAMATNDAPGAVAVFARYDELGESMHLLEPGYQRFHADYVEALVATGAVGTAIDVLDRFGERAERAGRVSALSAVHRGRALVAASDGDRDAAFAHAEAAVAVLDDTPLVYERSRALLTQGVVARRFKDRGAGRRALTDALTLFERMGAASLAERTRRELARISGRSPVGGRDVTTLTATETRVAELAAAGETTRQIAAALFISAKTVEANLTRIYRKLCVANRAQLASRLGAVSREAG